jgi:hypothetical protein
LKSQSLFRLGFVLALSSSMPIGGFAIGTSRMTSSSDRLHGWGEACASGLARALTALRGGGIHIGFPRKPADVGQTPWRAAIAAPSLQPLSKGS